MTVNEMIQELKVLQDRGLGDLKLYTENDSDYGLNYKEIKKLNIGDYIKYSNKGGEKYPIEDFEYEGQDKNYLKNKTIIKFEKAILCE